MVEVTLKLPDKVASALGTNPAAVARHVLEDVATEGYRHGRLSQREVGEMLGMDYWQAEEFLTSHKVSQNHSLADLEADRASLDKILGTK